jgi:hypothetical protein
MYLIAQQASCIKGINFVWLELLGTDSDDMVALATGNPTLGCPDCRGPAGLVSDLRVNRTAELQGGNDMAERAVENCLGKKNRTAEPAPLICDLPVEANAVYQAA